MVKNARYDTWLIVEQNLIFPPIHLCLSAFHIRLELSGFEVLVQESGNQSQ